MNPSTPDKKCPTCAKDKAILPGSIHMFGTLEHPAPHHTSPEKEISQEQETVDDKLSKPDNSYIDQVVEEFRNSFANAGGDYDGPLTPLETFLREKLEQQELAYLRRLEAAIVHHQETGKTAERQRIREIVEGMIEQNDDGMWSGREILDDLLARLSED